MREKFKMVCLSCLILILLPFVTTVFFQGIDAIPLASSPNSMLLLAQQENSQAARPSGETAREKPEQASEGDAGEKLEQASEGDAGEKPEQASEGDAGEKPEQASEEAAGEESVVDHAEDTEVQQEQLNYILLGLLANQIGSGAPREAVKAQAVVARSEYYYARKQGQEIPQGRSEEEMHQIWSEREYEKNYNFFMEVIQETAGQVLTCGGEPINAAYHAVSNGWTRTMAESTSQEGYDYLKSVECPRDIESENYLKVEYYEPGELAESILAALPECGLTEGEAASQISVLARDQEEYVTEIQVGAQSISGDSFREILELPSDCFYLEETEGKIRILTKGLGHGLGLSQYTAAVMAEEGEDYKKILEYFYSGAELSEKYEGNE